MPSDLSPSTCYSWGQASTLVIERRRPRLGEGMFRYYLDPEDFVRKQRVWRCPSATSHDPGLPPWAIGGPPRLGF